VTLVNLKNAPFWNYGDTPLGIKENQIVNLVHTSDTTHAPTKEK